MRYRAVTPRARSRWAHSPSRSECRETDSTRSTEMPREPHRGTDSAQQESARRVAPSRRVQPPRAQQRPASPESPQRWLLRVRDARARDVQARAMLRVEMQLQDVRAQGARAMLPRAEMQLRQQEMQLQDVQARCPIEWRYPSASQARGARVDAAADPQDARLLVALRSADNEARPLRNAARSTGRGHSASIASREAWRRILPSKPREIRSFLVETSKKYGHVVARPWRCAPTSRTLRLSSSHRRSSGESRRSRAAR